MKKISKSILEQSSIMTKKELKNIMGGSYPTVEICCDGYKYSGLCGFHTCAECWKGSPAGYDGSCWVCGCFY